MMVSVLVSFIIKKGVRQGKYSFLHTHLSLSSVDAWD